MLFAPEEWARILEQLGLTARQGQIALLILQGLKDQAIVDTLGMKKPTLRTHLRKIFRRLEVDNRLGLAVRIFVASRELEPLDEDHHKG